MKTVLNLILVAIILSSCQPKETEIKLNLEEGKEYKQVMEAKSVVIQDFNGQKMNLEMTIKGSTTYLVKSVNENNYEIEVKYDSLGFLMQLPQGQMEFSSEKNDEQDVFSMILAEMKKYPFQITVTKYGKVSEVENIDMLFESIFDSFPQIPENQKAQLRAQLQKAYGEEAFKGNIEMVTAIYPDKAVIEGDNWQIETKLESGMSADMTTIYTYVENNADYYLITGDSKIKTADKEAYIEANGMPVRYDLTGSMVSEIKVDKSSGWIIEAKVNQAIQGDVYIKDNPQVPGGMKVPMEMINDMVFTN